MLSFFSFRHGAARLIRDARTNRPKGFGFVTYASDAEAEKAIKSMDGRVRVSITFSFRKSVM